MKQCFSLHKICELYHICCFIRQSHGVEKWAIYHHGEYISVSEADASTQRLPGQVRREQETCLVSHFTGEVKRYFYARHKNMLVAFDY
ncbi:hypothetical protein [Enterobacter mori]|uniref:hypothetical protein n=1 Tax=Enterobacter mori TaxID=539813 RepID=UPI001B8D6A71|nr:hypothetical protein [Enterobacter mori]